MFLSMAAGCGMFVAWFVGDNTPRAAGVAGCRRVGRIQIFGRPRKLAASRVGAVELQCGRATRTAVSGANGPQPKGAHMGLLASINRIQLSEA
jgi:hypothetical protein